MNATITAVVRNNGTVTGSCRVNEGAPRGLVEYAATVPAIDAQGQALPPAQVKAALVAAWQAQRASQPAAPTDLSGSINGPVVL